MIVDRCAALDVHKNALPAGFVGDAGLNFRSDLGTLDFASVSAAITECGSLMNPADLRHSGFRRSPFVPSPPLTAIIRELWKGDQSRPRQLVETSRRTRQRKARRPVKMERHLEHREIRCLPTR